MDNIIMQVSGQTLVADLNMLQVSSNSDALAAFLLLNQDRFILLPA